VDFDRKTPPWFQGLRHLPFLQVLKNVAESLGGMGIGGFFPEIAGFFADSVGFCPDSAGLFPDIGGFG
jgi:hypothetical protein